MIRLRHARFTCHKEKIQQLKLKHTNTYTHIRECGSIMVDTQRDKAHIAANTHLAASEHPKCWLVSADFRGEKHPACPEPPNTPEPPNS